MSHQAGPDGRPPLVVRIIFSTFGLAFLGIGLTVIGFLWTAPFGEFGSPPLIFRLVGSFIACVFVVVGGSTAWAAITGAVGGPTQALRRLRQTHSQSSGGSTSYTCPRCSAPLSGQAEVSPHGDVKCTHCEAWFNIHQS